MTRSIWARTGITLAAVAMLAGCAGNPPNPKDPYEGFNRAMFSVNEALDKVAKPVAEGYDAVTPLPVRVGVASALGNVSDGMIGVNNVLQGKVSDGATDFARLLINSTLGVLGLFDVASEMGLDKHDEDIGQTLGKWGVGEGGYVFLPVIGPRTLRDAGGWVLDRQVDPISLIDHIPTRNTAVGVRFVDLRASLLPADKVIEEAALDKYAYIRDAYLQRRRALVYDGSPPKNPAQDDSSGSE